MKLYVRDFPELDNWKVNFWKPHEPHLSTWECVTNVQLINSSIYGTICLLLKTLQFFAGSGPGSTNGGAEVIPIGTPTRTAGNSRAASTPASGNPAPHKRPTPGPTPTPPVALALPSQGVPATLAPGGNGSGASKDAGGWKREFSRGLTDLA